MITQARVDEVRRLLATGKYSQREVSKMTEVSRGTVNKIAQGKRSDQVPARKAEERGLFEGPIERCPECGGRVYMPCLFCQARRLALKNPGAASGPNPAAFKEMSLKIELEGESLKQYEAIHQRRLLQGEPINETESWGEESDEFLPEMYFTSLLRRGELDVAQF
jgi:transcriptional regulator with XRE-family HTH domain